MYTIFKTSQKQKALTVLKRQEIKSELRNGFIYATFNDLRGKVAIEDTLRVNKIPYKEY